jgi:hypothetical protein
LEQDCKIDFSADVLQAGIMLASLTAIAAKGVSDVGGLSVIWQRAQDGNRIEFLK